MRVLARRRYEIGEPVEELKRRELDDAVRSRSRGRSRAAVPMQARRASEGIRTADPTKPQQS
jgi:hypothetical protein